MGKAATCSRWLRTNTSKQEAWLWRTPVLTVNERPTRIVCAAVGDVGWRVAGRRWPAVVAVVWDGLAASATLRLVGKSSRGVRGRRS